MAFEGIESKVKLLFKKDKLETDVVDEQAEYCITSAGSQVAKSLQVHELPERRIKEINNGEHEIPGTMDVSSHEQAK